MAQTVCISRAPLDAVAPATVPLPTTEFPYLCQICMDAPASVFQICGAECMAEVCYQCIVQHLIVNVYSFYPGVLPKIRCPVCLNLLNKSQWLQFVKRPDSESGRNVDDNSHILEKYKTLCRQSCGFQSPCCHNANYSMLPEMYHDESDESLKLELPIDQVEAVDELYRRGVEFCYHRQDVVEFYHFLTSTFHDNVDKLLWLFLPKIVDEERRAALLLRHLSKNPNTKTHCCGEEICFKCKVTNHHNGNCRDFIEDESVVECRGCGVTVVKVEGCNILHCICGFELMWTKEIERQRAQRKLLAPTDDIEYDKWALWHEKMSGTREKVKRVYQLERFVREHRALLGRLILPRVFRLRSKGVSRKIDDVKGDPVTSDPTA
ncbi:hypothetical protein P3T76_002367 [Phytophthora citrophthora]|uniref:RING-type domain-containing protein n=1 Tax=Phytophthora citrophthora TaxID=4793 RepID=A0AAD9GYK7_9STRA|nr:hypothetical protein P3T76_002367 [Phytophthora citrophthora]